MVDVIADLEPTTKVLAYYVAEGRERELTAADNSNIIL